MNKRYIGIDIGGTKCAVILSDAEGNILAKERFDTLSCQATLEKIYAAVGSYLPADAIGISCGGPLDSRTGTILSPPNLPGWDNIAITAMLRERFGIPAYLQNDANACAVAEWHFGAARGAANAVFLTFGTGMGAGLILNGRLYDGTNGNAGEVGHLRLAPFGPVGYGKRGSFEGFCSGGGIAQLGETLDLEISQTGRDSGLTRPITAKSLATDATMGNSTALEVYNTVGDYLGAGLSILIDLLNPEVIVIGSIYQRSGELLRERMEAVIAREALPGARAVCRIVPAKLGDNIGDIAAISIARAGDEGMLT